MKKEENAKKKLRLMTPEHRGWKTFANRLGGPEGCAFSRDANGNTTWRCKGGTDKTYAENILKTIPNIDVKGSLDYFEQHGGYCDCEILFNVDS